MRKNSNERISIWEGIKSNVQRRVRENARRLGACNDPDLRAILQRIQNDDLGRLSTANEFIAWHRQ